MILTEPPQNFFEKFKLKYTDHCDKQPRYNNEKSQTKNININLKTSSGIDSVKNRSYNYAKRCLFSPVSFGAKMDISDDLKRCNDKVLEILYDGIEEPEYEKVESEPYKYKCIDAIKSYYDENGVLRKKTRTNCYDTVLDVDLYDKNGNIIYRARSKYLTDGAGGLEIARLYFSNQEKINTEEFILSFEDLSVTKTF